MSALHLYYQTRWAARNDPALGFVMILILAAFLSWHETIRKTMRLIKREMLEGVIHALATQQGSKGV